ncbi:hypothetical protein [Microbulbifer spongiae]|uniref:DUF1570 domain-containing protein n=1 Tax=Microbulbifer spongiae TaxID=2944933 RepID=A0ABY9E6L0_9GAMM|nr:hypothetical protein [Microbulbifer sp. MI-G]WKD48658.1 hypothetical protein M8T91_12120 [Microbulbifer sp. MI-G]
MKNEFIIFMFLYAFTFSINVKGEARDEYSYKLPKLSYKTNIVDLIVSKHAKFDCDGREDKINEDALWGGIGQCLKEKKWKLYINRDNLKEVLGENNYFNIEFAIDHEAYHVFAQYSREYYALTDFERNPGNIIYNYNQSFVDDSLVVSISNLISTLQDSDASHHLVCLMTEQWLEQLSGAMNGIKLYTKNALILEFPAELYSYLKLLEREKGSVDFSTYKRERLKYSLNNSVHDDYANYLYLLGPALHKHSPELFTKKMLTSNPSYLYKKVFSKFGCDIRACSH